MNIYHLRDLICGRKKIISASAIKSIFVPQYENLTIEKILTQARGVEAIANKLPDKDSETKKFPKKYVCDIIYTTLGEDFKGWIKE